MGLTFWIILLLRCCIFVQGVTFFGVEDGVPAKLSLNPWKLFITGTTANSTRDHWAWALSVYDIANVSYISSLPEGLRPPRVKPNQLKPVVKVMTSFDRTEVLDSWKRTWMIYWPDGALEVSTEFTRGSVLQGQVKELGDSRKSLISRIQSNGNGQASNAFNMLSILLSQVDNLNGMGFNDVVNDPLTLVVTRLDSLTTVATPIEKVATSIPEDVTIIFQGFNNNFTRDNQIDHGNLEESNDSPSVEEPVNVNDNVSHSRPEVASSTVLSVAMINAFPTINHTRPPPLATSTEENEATTIGDIPKDVTIIFEGLEDSHENHDTLNSDKALPSKLMSEVPENMTITEGLESLEESAGMNHKIFKERFENTTESSTIFGGPENVTAGLVGSASTSTEKTADEAVDLEGPDFHKVDELRKTTIAEGLKEIATTSITKPVIEDSDSVNKGLRLLSITTKTTPLLDINLKPIIRKTTTISSILNLSTTTEPKHVGTTFKTTITNLEAPFTISIRPHSKPEVASSTVPTKVTTKEPLLLNHAIPPPLTTSPMLRRPSRTSSETLNTPDIRRPARIFQPFVRPLPPVTQRPFNFSSIFLRQPNSMVPPSFRAAERPNPRLLGFNSGSAYNQTRPLGSLNRPAYNQPRSLGPPNRPSYNQPRPLGPPNGPSYNQPRPLGNPNGPSYNQPRPVSPPNWPVYNQALPLGNPNGPSYNHPRPVSPSNGPVYNQARPVSPSNGPVYNQARPLGNPNGPSYNQPRPLSPPNGPVYNQARPLGNPNESDYNQRRPSGPTNRQIFNQPIGPTISQPRPLDSPNRPYFNRPQAAGPPNGLSYLASNQRYGTVLNTPYHPRHIPDAVSHGSYETIRRPLGSRYEVMGRPNERQFSGRRCRAARDCDDSKNERCVSQQGIGVCDCGRRFQRDSRTGKCI